MAIRIFRCKECGHRMRLSGRSCGMCGADKSIYQTATPYEAMFLLGMLGVSAGILVMGLQARATILLP